MPISTPKIVESSVEIPTSAIVGQARLAISLITGSFEMYERPKLSCAVCLT